MRCQACHYRLENLPEHRCPECGRAFDPNNPDTFIRGHLLLQPKWILIGLGLLWLIAALALLSPFLLYLWDLFVGTPRSPRVLR